MSTIAELAQRQLAAYNTADLDGFCACYHPQVAVWDDTSETLRRRCGQMYRALERLDTITNVEHDGQYATCPTRSTRTPWLTWTRPGCTWVAEGARARDEPRLPRPGPGCTGGVYARS